MTDSAVAEQKMLSRKSPEVVAYIQMVEKAKRDAEVVTLREWYDSTPNHKQEIIDYMEAYKQLGPLGKELHKRGVKRVTERFGDNVRTLVEATYQRGLLDTVAPLCSLACVITKSKKQHNEK
jgi:putative IMPACT (imprinted ancient) family translation regulator